jgi:hypothetical protein
MLEHPVLAGDVLARCVPGDGLMLRGDLVEVVVSVEQVDVFERIAILAAQVSFSKVNRSQKRGGTLTPGSSRPARMKLAARWGQIRPPSMWNGDSECPQS